MGETANVRELTSAPGFPGLFAKAALASTRRANGSAELPSTVYIRPQVDISATSLAEYDRVCGFRLRDELPPTYPHLLGFPLQMKLMTDPDFPFAPIGTVHVANRITVHRPISLGETLELRVHAENLRDHPRGRQFDVITESVVDGAVVWHSVSTYLLRSKAGARSATVEGGGGRREGKGSGDRPAERPDREAPPNAVWRLGEDTGRRYAAVSGDANPIHLHALSAKVFGFPRAIAHGMWTKARCLAALEASLPEAYTVDVRFAKPALLPSTVEFREWPQDDGRGFELRKGAKGDGTGRTVHLRGEITSA